MVAYGDDDKSTTPDKLAVIDLGGRTLSRIDLSIRLYGADGLAFDSSSDTAIMPGQDLSQFDRKQSLWRIDFRDGRTAPISSLTGLSETEPLLIDNQHIAMLISNLISQPPPHPYDRVAVLDVANGVVSPKTPECQIAGYPAYTGGAIVYQAYAASSGESSSLWRLPTGGTPQLTSQLALRFLAISNRGEQIEGVVATIEPQVFLGTVKALSQGVVRNSGVRACG